MTQSADELPVQVAPASDLSEHVRLAWRAYDHAWEELLRICRVKVCTLGEFAWHNWRADRLRRNLNDLADELDRSTGTKTWRP